VEPRDLERHAVVTRAPDAVLARRVALRVVTAPLIMAVATAAPSGAIAQTVSGTPAGTWRGPWYLGMSSGAATLVIGVDTTDGTLQFTNNDAFGEAVVALRDVRFDGGVLRFAATGADGKRLVCELPVDLDRGRLKGFVTYGGYKLRIELARVAGA
jgi:hypothetical protein